MAESNQHYRARVRESETTTAKELHQRTVERTSKVGHTPGPWEIHSTPLTGAAGIYAPWPKSEPHRNRIAILANSNDADARLIASAPELLRQRDELLEAAEGLVASLGPIIERVAAGIAPGTTSPALERLRAAIASAKGE